MTANPSETILDRLLTLHPKLIDLGLERVYALLDRLGAPHEQLAPVVHIAGTNGKGSTLAMLDAMCQAAGLRTQRYVSPHLVHFNERLLFDDHPIDEAALVDVLEEVEAANAGAPITFFEITTVAAFLAFSRQPADILLLETGLGGRLDATNVIARPALSLISRIGFDHQAFLGDTLEQIAFEKAGIFKPDTLALSCAQEPAALGVLGARAHDIGTRLQVCPDDWQVEASADGLQVMTGSRMVDLPRPALPGAHQLVNAGLAVRAALALADAGWPLSDAAIAHGLRRVTWAARLQRLDRAPWIDRLGDGAELWLDGGHNVDAGVALSAWLDDQPRDRRPALIIGMLANKDAYGFLEPLARHRPEITAVPIEGAQATWDPADGVRLAERLGLSACTAANWRAALTALRPKAAELRIMIVGSLYLAGDVLRDSTNARG